MLREQHEAFNLEPGIGGIAVTQVIKRGVDPMEKDASEFETGESLVNAFFLDSSDEGESQTY